MAFLPTANVTLHRFISEKTSHRIEWSWFRLSRATKAAVISVLAKTACDYLPEFIYLKACRHGYDELSRSPSPRGFFHVPCVCEASVTDQAKMLGRECVYELSADPLLWEYVRSNIQDEQLAECSSRLPLPQLLRQCCDAVLAEMNTLLAAVSVPAVPSRDSYADVAAGRSTQQRHDLPPINDFQDPTPALPPMGTFYGSISTWVATVKPEYGLGD